MTSIKKDTKLGPMVYATNIMCFCAAHRLHNEDLSDEENRECFGKCNHISSHGHNYKIEATVQGRVIPAYGFPINLRDLKVHLGEVIEPLDHKRLDTDIEFFKQKDVIATAENIGIYIWDELAKLLPPTVQLYNIRVWETDKNYIDYKGEQ